MIEKDPLIITHKVYIVDSNKNQSIDGFSFSITAGNNSTKSKVSNLSTSSSRNYSFAMHYEKTLNFWRARIGIGYGSYLIKAIETTSSIVQIENKTTRKEVVERFFKLKGNDTTWYDITEDREIIVLSESVLVQENKQVWSCQYVQVPISFGVLKRIGKFELESGIDLDARSVWINHKSGAVFNMLAGVHINPGYVVKEKYRLNIKSAYLTDIVSISNQFKSNYLQIGL